MSDKKLRSLSRAEIADTYGAHHKAVFRLCMSFMKNEQEAADMTEETFLRWIEAPKRPPPDRIEPWLIVTAGNLCRDALRRKKRHPQEDIEAAYDLSAGDSFVARSELLSAVMDLPEKYKTVVFLFYYEGMTVEEIARAAGLRRATVRSQLTRARQMLRKVLGDEENGAHQKSI